MREIFDIANSIANIATAVILGVWILFFRIKGNGSGNRS